MSAPSIVTPESSSWSLCNPGSLASFFSRSKKVKPSWDGAKNYFAQFHSELANQNEKTKNLLDQHVQALDLALERGAELEHSYQHQVLHYDLCGISEKLGNAAKTNKLWGLWKKVLAHLDGAPMKMPDERSLRLDCTREVAMTTKGYEAPSYTLDVLDHSSPTFFADFQQVYQMILRNFSGNELRTPQGFLYPMIAPNSKVLLARDEKTNKVLGVLWYYYKTEAKKDARLSCICRREDAARLGIGRFLLDRLIHHELKGAEQVSLNVRACKHRIRNLYEGYGFKVVRQKPYYTGPSEDSCTMHLDLRKK